MGNSGSTPSPIAAIPDITYCDMTYTSCNTITNQMSVTCVANPTVTIPEATTNHYLQSILQIDSSIIPDGVTLTDVTVHTQFFHDYPGDLIMGLFHGSAAIELFGNSGPGCDNPSALPNNIDVTFDDTATAGPITGASCVGCTGGYCGTYKPVSSLLAFDTLTANGQWMLEMADTAGGDVGTFGEWTLTFTLSSYCTAQPTTDPTKNPTKNPSLSPTEDPTVSYSPSLNPSINPTLLPTSTTNTPTATTLTPTAITSFEPTLGPTTSEPTSKNGVGSTQIENIFNSNVGGDNLINAGNDKLIKIVYILVAVFIVFLLILIVIYLYIVRRKKERLNLRSNVKKEGGTIMVKGIELNKIKSVEDSNKQETKRDEPNDDSLINDMDNDMDSMNMNKHKDNDIVETVNTLYETTKSVKVKTKTKIANGYDDILQMDTAGLVDELENNVTTKGIMADDIVTEGLEN